MTEKERARLVYIARGQLRRGEQDNAEDMVHAVWLRCSEKGITYLPYLIGTLMNACKYPRYWISVPARTKFHAPLHDADKVPDTATLLPDIWLIHNELLLRIWAELPPTLLVQLHEWIARDYTCQTHAQACQVSRVKRAIEVIAGLAHGSLNQVYGEYHSEKISASVKRIWVAKKAKAMAAGA
jgi:hypothetical protein